MFDYKIVTWNVNSIRAQRSCAELVTGKRAGCDLPSRTEMYRTDFPFDEVSSLGYAVTMLGQKTYNGVAILSFEEPEDIILGMDDGVDDPQARLVSARIDGIRTVCVYVPNGGEMGSDKWSYKLQWYKRLRSWLGRRIAR